MGTASATTRRASRPLVSVARPLIPFSQRSVGSRESCLSPSRLPCSVTVGRPLRGLSRVRKRARPCRCHRIGAQMALSRPGGQEARQRDGNRAVQKNAVSGRQAMGRRIGEELTLPVRSLKTLRRVLSAPNWRVLERFGTSPQQSPRPPPGQGGHRRRCKTRRSEAPVNPARFRPPPSVHWGSSPPANGSRARRTPASGWIHAWRRNFRTAGHRQPTWRRTSVPTAHERNPRAARREWSRPWTRAPLRAQQEATHRILAWKQPPPRPTQPVLCRSS